MIARARLEPQTPGTTRRHSSHGSSWDRYTNAEIFDLCKIFKLFKAFLIKTRTKAQELRKLSKNMAWLIHYAVRLCRCLHFVALCQKTWPFRRRHRRWLPHASADNSWLPSFSTSWATKRRNLTPFSQITGSRLRIDDLDTFIPPLHHKIEQKSTNLT